MIIALAGRRIDAPGADPVRFPLANQKLVRERIKQFLIVKDASALVTSAACGADLLALESALGLGLRCRVVLPFAPARFRTTSVVDRPGDWGAVYDRVIDAVKQNDDLVVLGDAGTGQAAYSATNEAVLDQAQALARDASAPVLALIVWDQQTRAGMDASAAFADAARRRGIEIGQIATL